MTRAKNPHRGTSLATFLQDEGMLEEASAIAVKRVIAWQLEEAMRSQNLSKSAMAARMETSRRQLDRVLSPEDGNVTLETLQRAAKAVGRTIRLELA
ncbi:MAG: Fis family transcriptional regulator [Rhizobiaceae bacterium]